jgi:cell division protein FtsL
MTDWADGIETRNYGIKNEIDAGMMSELLRNIIPLAMIAGAFLFYSWVRSQIVNTGYESQNLFKAEESLLRNQKRLILVEETLRDPRRIEGIARNELGMTPLRLNQFIMPTPDTERALYNTLAMAESEATGLKTAGDSGIIPAN